MKMLIEYEHEIRKNVASAQMCFALEMTANGFYENIVTRISQSKLTVFMYSICPFKLLMASAEMRLYVWNSASACSILL